MLEERNAARLDADWELELKLRRDIKTSVKTYRTRWFTEIAGTGDWHALSSIVEAYQALLPEAVPWEKWCTKQACDTVLPCGERRPVNRGAGQGEPDGPLKTSVTIGRAMQDGKSQMTPETRDGMVDVWYMDDGQIFTKPGNVHEILVMLDQRLARIGATRGRKSVNGSVKNIVRVYAPADRQNEVAGWDTAYVRDTCNVLSSADVVKELCKKVEALHSTIEQVQHAATEVVLKKACADVSKVVYTLRLDGDRLVNNSRNFS